MHKLPLFIICSLVTISVIGALRVYAFAPPSLGCEHIEPERENDICLSLSKHREWRWFRGTHVPLLPGWDVTWKKAKVTFCELHITRDDLEALKFLQNTNFFNKHKGFMDLPRKQQESFYELQDQELFDFDLSNGAEILIKILEDADKEPKQRLFAGLCQEAR